MFSIVTEENGSSYEVDFYPIDTDVMKVFYI